MRYYRGRRRSPKAYGEGRPQRLRPRVGDGRVRLLRARMVAEARGRSAYARRRGARGRDALAREPRPRRPARAPPASRLGGLRLPRAGARGRARPRLVARMTYGLALVALCLRAAALARLAAARESKRTGLPTGALLYGDTHKPVGRVAPAEVGRDGRKQERPLVSHALSLVGRPDYLIETDDGVVPVEAKSSNCPPGGRPYDSHLAQLAAYCLLVEDVLGAEVPYGLVKYRDREVRVEYTDELREHGLSLLEEMKRDA